MIGEVDLHGVLVAPLLVWMLVAYGLTAILRSVLARTGFYRLVWHPSLFDVSLYVVIVGGVVALVSTGIVP